MLNSRDEPDAGAAPEDRYRRFSTWRLLVLMSVCGACFSLASVAGSEGWFCCLLVLALLTIPALFGPWREVGRGVAIAFGIVLGGLVPVFVLMAFGIHNPIETAFPLVGIGAAACGFLAAKGWSRLFRGWDRWSRRRESQTSASKDETEQLG